MKGEKTQVCYFAGQFVHYRMIGSVFPFGPGWAESTSSAVQYFLSSFFVRLLHSADIPVYDFFYPFVFVVQFPTSSLRLLRKYCCSVLSSAIAKQKLERKIVVGVEVLSL